MMSSQLSQHSQPSPLLRLPAEIRLMIYDQLFLPQDTNSPRMSSPYKVVHQDRHDHHHHHHHEGSTNEHQQQRYNNSLRLRNRQHIASIRTLDPERSPLPGWLTQRSKYLIRTSRFRHQTRWTTYTLEPAIPSLASSMALLRTCRSLHEECTAHIYSHYTFDFSTHIEAMVPFLTDLSPLARSRIRRLSFSKRALPYCTEADRAEWKEAMRFLASPASNLDVAALTLRLGVAAGKPGPQGWDDVPALDKAYFQSLLAAATTTTAEKREGREEMEWAVQLSEIRGLQALSVRAIVEHAPSPESSSSMVFWVLLSKSVETGLRDWLAANMLAAAQ